MFLLYSFDKLLDAQNEEVDVEKGKSMSHAQRQRRMSKHALKPNRAYCRMTPAKRATSYVIVNANTTHTCDCDMIPKITAWSDLEWADDASDSSLVH